MVLNKIRVKKPRIVRLLAHEVTTTPQPPPSQSLAKQVPRHWWEEEDDFVKEVPWAQSLEYLKLQMKFKSFGQYTSTVYRGGRGFL